MDLDGRQPHPPCSGPFVPADPTWTYSFSGAFLFVMGFVVAGLCYLSYRYITKQPQPPNSLVSSPPGPGGRGLRGPHSSGGQRPRDPWLSLKCRKPGLRSPLRPKQVAWQGV